MGQPHKKQKDPLRGGSIMTEEQLRKGNEIATQINELKCFLSAFNDEYGANVIEAEYVKRRDEFTGHQMSDKTLDLIRYPDLSKLIVSYISDKISNLEKQLEEL